MNREAEANLGGKGREEEHRERRGPRTVWGHFFGEQRGFTGPFGEYRVDKVARSKAEDPERNGNRTAIGRTCS
jgi:hypothetical protein